MTSRRLFWCMIACFAVDVFNKNFYLSFSDPKTVERVYWTGQSFSFLCYVTFVWAAGAYLYSIVKDKWTLLLKLAALNYIVFAITDFIDEVTGQAGEVLWVEYGALVITIILTIRAWKKHMT